MFVHIRFIKWIRHLVTSCKAGWCTVRKKQQRGTEWVPVPGAVVLAMESPNSQFGGCLSMSLLVILVNVALGYADNSGRSPTFREVAHDFIPWVPFQKHVASWKTRCVEGFDPARDVLRKTKNTKTEPGTPDLHRFGVLFLASSTVIKDTLGHGHMRKLEGVQVGLSLSNS